MGPADWIRSYRTKEDNTVTDEAYTVAQVSETCGFSRARTWITNATELLTIGLVTETRGNTT